MLRTGDESRRPSEDTPECTQLLHERTNPPAAAFTGVGAAAMAYPGIEVVPSSDNDKQIPQPEKEALYSEHLHRSAAEPCQPGKDTAYPEPLDKSAAEPFIFSDKGQVTSQSQSVKRRVCGLRPLVFWASLVAAVLVIGIALGAGLGVGLNKEDSEGTSSDSQSSASLEPADTQSPFEIGGNIDASYYSNQNAWNGSGLAYLWQTLPPQFKEQPTNNRSLVLYYQHNSGEIRWMRRVPDEESGGQWWLGSKFPVVTDSAKNSTPISAVTTTQGGSDVWNIFYIDKDHMVRQRSASRTSQEWTDGPINDLKLSAYDGDLVGLYACDTSKDPTAPVRLWFASDNTTFQEYVFNGNEWSHEKSWEGYRGGAGIGCFSGEGGDFVYAALVNTDNVLEFWSQSIADNPSSWERTNFTIKDVYPATSVSLSRYICVFQKREDPRLSVPWLNLKNGTIRPGEQRSTITQNAMICGTHITALADGNNHLLYSQALGNDIEQSERTLLTFEAKWQTDNIAFDTKAE